MYGSLNVLQWMGEPIQCAPLDLLMVQFAAYQNKQNWPRGGELTQSCPWLH